MDEIIEDSEPEREDAVIRPKLGTSKSGQHRALIEPREIVISSSEESERSLVAKQAMLHISETIATPSLVHDGQSPKKKTRRIPPWEAQEARRASVSTADSSLLEIVPITSASTSDVIVTKPKKVVKAKAKRKQKDLAETSDSFELPTITHHKTISTDSNTSSGSKRKRYGQATIEIQKASSLLRASLSKSPDEGSTYQSSSILSPAPNDDDAAPRRKKGKKHADVSPMEQSPSIEIIEPTKLNFDQSDRSSHSDSDLSSTERLHNTVDKFNYGKNGAAVASSSRVKAVPNARATSPPMLIDEPAASEKKTGSKTGRTVASIVKSSKTPQIDLPPNSHIAPLTNCPLCQMDWPIDFSVARRITHLKRCSAEKDYTAETVRVLTENSLLIVSEALVEERKDEEKRRTLFDRAIGAGEGKASREIRVVAVEGGALPSKFNDELMLKETQKELEERQKKKVDKVIGIAKEIKIARRKANPASKAASVSENDDIDLGSDIEQPQPTGALRGPTLHARKKIASRAEAVIDSIAGSGLTQASLAMSQAPSRLSGPSDRVKNSSILKALDAYTSKRATIENGQGESADEARSPPPTQQFESSKLVQKFVQQDRGEVITLPMRDNPIIANTDDVATRQTERSLWKAAGDGRPEAVNKVVPRLPFASSKTSVDRSKGKSLKSTRRATREGSGSGESVDQVQVSSKLRRTEKTASDATSEDEPLRKVLKKKKADIGKKTKPAKTAAKKKRVQSSSDLSASDISASDEESDEGDEYPGLPDYSSLPTSTLQAEVKRYGFRISKEKSVLVQQLTDVWKAMHPPKKKKSKKTRQKKKIATETEEDEVTESISERLRKAIVAKKALYVRILRYEPIHFDEFIALTSDSKIKCSRMALMRQLDTMCITFYIQDPTNGSRSRFA